MNYDLKLASYLDFGLLLCFGEFHFCILTGNRVYDRWFLVLSVAVSVRDLDRVIVTLEEPFNA